MKIVLLFFGALGLELAFPIDAARAESTNLVTIIDLLVVYTPASQAAVGGADAMQAQVKTALMEANLVMENSRVNARIRLVHCAEVSYQESGSLSNDLARFRNPTDGFLDDVHTLREQYAADLACLVIETGTDYWFYGLQGPSAANAFSAILRSYFTGYYFFPVTLSFNFGCQMERPAADSVGAFPYAYGISRVAPDGETFGTVESLNWRRLALFSNPNIGFEGVPCGIPAGQPYAADNAKTINQTAPLVAAFKGLAPRTQLPVVRFVNPLGSPENPVTVEEEGNLVINVEAFDPDGTVNRVDFFDLGSSTPGQAFLGSVSNSPFTFTWTKIAAGGHQLRAIVTDNLGASASSQEDLFVSATPKFSPRVNSTAITEWSGTNAPANDSGLLASSTSVYVEPKNAYNIAGAEIISALTNIPANDDFEDRILLSGFEAGTMACNINATKEAGEPNHAGQVGGYSVWWSWLAPASGRARIAILNQGPKLGSYLAVYTGSSVTNLVPVASAVSPVLDFDVAEGVSYEIAVDSRSGYLNDPLLLQLATPPVNDDFANRLLLTDWPLRVEGNIILATLEPDEIRVGGGSGKTIWWSWTAPTPAAIRISTADSVFLPTDSDPYFGPGIRHGPLVSVYAGDTLTNLMLVASNSIFLGEPDPPGGAWRVASNLLFEANAGTTYQISVDGCNGSSGKAVLNFEVLAQSPPLNDSFSNRITLAGTSISIAASNYLASLEPGETNLSVQLGGSSVWWSWTAAKRGRVSITVTAPFTPLTAVYTGNSLATLTPVASGNTDTSFFVEPGKTYQISIDGASGEQGEFGWSLNFGPSPVNDMFVDAQRISGTQLVVDGSTIDASLEEGEPILPENTGNSVWYKWQAPVNGTVVVKMLSGFGTIAVYAGRSVSNLMCVSVPPGDGGFYQASFYAAVGQAYYIGVFDEFSYTDTFSFELIAPPLPPQICADLEKRADGSFRFSIDGVIGQSFVLEASTNLSDWIVLAIDTILDNRFDVIDSEAGLFTYRFYRVLPLEALFTQNSLRVSLVPSSPGGPYAIHISGPPGQPFILRASTNLIHWEELNQSWIIGEGVDLLDGENNSRPLRFYQALSLE